MIVVFGFMVALSLVLSVAFAVALGPPWTSRNPTMTWLQASLAWSAALFDTVVLLAVLNVRVSPWLVLVVLLSQDVVFGWRLWLLLKVRNTPPPNG